MQVIKVKSSLSTEIFPEFDTIRTIEISDTIISDGEGGFGKVFNCISVNAKKSSVDQLVKILTPNKNIHKQGYKTIQKLQTKLKNKNQELKQNKAGSIKTEYKALQAVPQFSFIGNLNGEEVYGYSANNLNSLGFISFKEALSKRIIGKVSWENKVAIIYHLVKAFEFLSSIYFIHADLKDDALFLNTSTNECAIIDFDGGIVADNPNDKPTTIGSRQKWLAPEILEQFDGSSGDLQKININLNSDRWSVTVAIFYLICSCTPFFMLTNTAAETITDYFSKYKWPDINPQEQYFNKYNEVYYHKFISWYKQHLPLEIRKVFETTFGRGYHNEALRSTYNSWKYALLNIQKLPQIKEFSCNKRNKTNSTPIKLRWDVNNADVLILQPGNINVTGRKDYTVNPNTDTTYTLIAKNYCGDQKKKLTIKISKLPPLIKKFEPNKSIRTGTDPVKLFWDVDNYDELLLNPGNINITAKNSIEVKPLADTNYTLIAKSFSGSVSQKSIAIKISKQPPVINEFKPDIPVRLDSKPVKLYWDIDNAHRLTLNPGNKDITGRNDILVEPMSDTTYTLIAKSFFGSVSQKSISIKISTQPPIINQFKPEKPVRLDSKPVKLYWDVDNAHRLILNPGNKDITGRDNIEVEPLADTIYTLIAKSFFGKETKSSIMVTVSKEPPVIKQFDYEVIDFADNVFKLTWEVENGEHIEILPYPGKVSNKKNVEIKLTNQNEFTLTASTIFGVKTSKSISINTLFNLLSLDNFFNTEPDNNIFNKKVRPEVFHQLNTRNYETKTD